MSNQSRQQEIDTIQHDLENLFARYAAIQQAAGWAKTAAKVYLIALALLILFGLSAGSMEMAVIAALTLAWSLAVAYSLRTARWIDVVSASSRGNFFVNRPTEAMAVEDMIQDRQARLAELMGEKT